MATNSFSVNPSGYHSNTTTKPHNSELCPPIQNAYFETSDSSVPYIVNAALNVPLVITTTLANILVLLAMRHVASIRLPSKLLLCSLVLTDLGTGLVVQPQLTVLLFMKAINPYSVNCFFVKSLRVTGTFFSAVSLFTMTAISLDRYSALFLHLNYRKIVSTKRVSAFLTFAWLFSLFVASASLWNKVIWKVAFMNGFFICFFVMSMAYIKIYRGLRGLQGHLGQPQANKQAQQQAGSTLNMEKQKRTASAMMWLYVLFVICYLPFLCVVTFVAAIGFTALTQYIWEFSFTVIILNSFLNPFVYCLRLSEIQTEVAKQLRQFCCRTPR